MPKPTDMVVPMLREMRAESGARHGEVLARFDRVEQRLQKLEDAQVSFKQALTADSLLSKLVTGEFEERIEALEAKVRELEARR
jgi:hypothetical protein